MQGSERSALSECVKNTCLTLLETRRSFFGFCEGCFGVYASIEGDERLTGIEEIRAPGTWDGNDARSRRRRGTL